MQNLILKSSEDFAGDGVGVFLEWPEGYLWVWVDSVDYESDEFDEEHQCMVIKTKHTYTITGVTELCTISFDCDKPLPKIEIIKRINYKLKWGLYNKHELGEDDY